MNLDDFHVVYGRGRRKTATVSARIRVPYKDSRKFVNMIIIDDDTNIEEYFDDECSLISIYCPLIITEMLGKIDIRLRISGGGKMAQSQAASIAIARGIVQVKPSYRSILQAAGLLRTDGRQVERKKYGYKKARRGFQFSKR